MNARLRSGKKSLHGIQHSQCSISELQRASFKAREERAAMIREVVQLQEQVQISTNYCNRDYLGVHTLDHTIQKHYLMNKTLEEILI